MEGLSAVSVFSLAFTAAMALISVVGGARLAKKYRSGSTDKWVIVWLIYDALTHFILEGAFVYYSLTGTVNDAKGPMAELWKEYTKADARWGVSDPTIVSLEILTVFFDGLLCVVLVYGIVKRRPWRHYVQIVLCVCELYGGWMTFCPEWITGSPNLDTSNPLYLWVYLVFFNGLWVVIPLAMMWQSWQDTCVVHQTYSSVRGRKAK